MLSVSRDSTHIYDIQVGNDCKLQEEEDEVDPHEVENDFVGVSGKTSQVLGGEFTNVVGKVAW